MESGTAACEIAAARAIGSAQPVRAARSRKVTWSLALAASFALFAAGLAGLRLWRPAEPKGSSSRAVAMLNHTVDAHWSQPGDIPRKDAPLEPGRLRLTSGLAQIVFYSGVRVVIEGPAELELLSQNAIFCRFGRLTAAVPPQTRGFRVSTAPLSVTGMGTSMALQVTDSRTELHVFKGSVELETTANAARHRLKEGAGAVAESSGALRLTYAEPAIFASMFDLDAKSLLAETQGYEQGAPRAIGSIVTHRCSFILISRTWGLRTGGSPIPPEAARRCSTRRLWVASGSMGAGPINERCNSRA
jgi:hypothetical protein